MRFLQVLTIVLTQLSISTLLIVSLLSPANLRHGFFRVQCLLCGLTAAVALGLTRFAAEATWWDVRFLALTILGAVLGYVAFRFDRPQLGRLCMIVAGLLGVVFGLLPLAGQTMASWGLRTKAPQFFELGFIFGAVLLGTTQVAFVLAYWYRHLRSPAYTHLAWLSEAVLIAVGLRLVLLAATLFFLGDRDPQLAEQLVAPLQVAGPRLLLFLARVAAGLVVPLAAALVALQAAREHDDRRATRVLALATLSVWVGELCAAHLLI